MVRDLLLTGRSFNVTKAAANWTCEPDAPKRALGWRGLRQPVVSLTGNGAAAKAFVKRFRIGVTTEMTFSATYSRPAVEEGCEVRGEHGRAAVLP